jgi:2-dehydro-3-deoxy-D-arabinonate dehydratase
LLEFWHATGPGADAAGPAVITSLAAVALPDLLALPLRRIREICQDPGGETVPANQAELLAPVSGRTEVWAAGVTYQRSRTARMAESEHSADIYDRVYAAERPELFFKSAAWRVCGPGAPVSVRADSSIDVPEPELAVVLNYAGEVAGYTICNDMSSRSIEGENPLYLPQAKIYLGGCAVGPADLPAPSWSKGHG